jgi:hypothetical protein
VISCSAAVPDATTFQHTPYEQNRAIRVMQVMQNKHCRDRRRVAMHRVPLLKKSLQLLATRFVPAVPAA